ncbi:MAG TPA: hypothetical protein PLE42_12985 [Candidatus Competibacteraceae bacterium]|nr:MAG: hypothetical protein EKK69_07475 [Candidatus Competibacteraceae bacterium]HNW79621.1 hypothetical protein [Candidatus Competibacteraceae bacterium]HQC73619.1 hypothetical protein [Candidatus Competibacteraceae bacterium]
MSEPESTPRAPTVPVSRSLLRRLLTPSNIGFYLMIVLAWIGAIYTTFSVEQSRWYWQWLIPVFGLICIATQWNNVGPTLKGRGLMVLRQVLHWGVVLLMSKLIFMASGQVSSIDALDDRQASLVLMFTVTLSTFLAGVYFDWRLCVVAVFLIASAILNVALSNTAPLLVWIGIGVIVVYFIGDWWYSRFRERHAAPNTPDIQ